MQLVPASLQLVHDQWRCVVMFGGGHHSQFYVGDLEHEPTFRGAVQCDIGDRVTERIGFIGQGPGDVASVSVFADWERLNWERMRRVYRESLVHIQGSWNKTEAQRIKKMLMLHIGVEGVVMILLRQLLGVLVETYSL